MGQPKYKLNFFGKILFYPAVIFAVLFLVEIFVFAITHKEIDGKIKLIIGLSTFLILEMFTDILNGVKSLIEKCKDRIKIKKRRAIQQEIIDGQCGIIQAERTREKIAAELELILKSDKLSEDNKQKLVNKFIDRSDTLDSAIEVLKKSVEKSQHKLYLFTEFGYNIVQGRRGIGRTYTTNALSYLEEYQAQLVHRRDFINKRQEILNNSIATLRARMERIEDVEREMTNNVLIHDSLEDVAANVELHRRYFAGADSLYPDAEIQIIEMNDMIHPGHNSLRNLMSGVDDPENIPNDID